MAVDPWQLLILTGTVLFTVSLLPQVIRTLQRRRADDISILFTVLVILASACNMVYFYHLEEWVAGTGFIFNLFAWGLVLYFRLRPGQPSSGGAPSRPL